MVAGNGSTRRQAGSTNSRASWVLGVLLAVVGLIDDLGNGLSPWLRLFIEIAAGLGVWWLGISLHLAGVPQPVDALVTVVWVVGITNAFNLLDNMDGLSGGIAIIAALAIFGVSLLQQRYLVSALALALAGCAAGFLRRTSTRQDLHGRRRQPVPGVHPGGFVAQASIQCPDPGASGRDTGDTGRGHLRYHPCDGEPRNPPTSARSRVAGTTRAIAW